ncbi:MAG: hypothetical protein Q9167_001352 [Letrouitia subvulpina]
MSHEILDISSTATQQQIRDAYKKQALKSHPDRVPADSPERPARTKKFQQINDAYFTLSDPTRRRDYDATRAFHDSSSPNEQDSDPEEEIPRQSPPGSFPWSSFGAGANPQAEREKFTNEQFGSVFEEMLRDEGLAEGHEAKPTGKFWSLVGGLSGGAMGFIIANVPGALAGAVAGNRLGAVRDARGKSVYSVFLELPQGDKAKLLSELAAKSEMVVDSRRPSAIIHLTKIGEDRGLPLKPFVITSRRVEYDTKYEPAVQIPIQVHETPATNKSISTELFRDLEELSRIVDIAYCVGATWNTGLLFSDNCGYLALSHPPAAPRIILAFRGTYSLANTITDLSTIPQEYTPYPNQEECVNCTVHAGFMNSWTLTKPLILNHLETLKTQYPNYQLTLVGHSLGGAIAALASLEFQAIGWKPKVTTFGEPKVGNIHLVRYFDRLFRSNQSHVDDTYRRITHVGDPIPLLPLDEMGFRAHAAEIFISKPEIRPEITDLHRYPVLDGLGGF